MFSSRPLPFALLWLASRAAGQACDLQFDGRVPSNFEVSTFDDQNGVFSPDNVFGAGMWLALRSLAGEGI